MKIDLSKLVDIQALDLTELLAQINAGDPAARFIGSYIVEGGFGLLEQVSDEEAAAWARQGAEAGDALCMIRYGHLMFAGHGVPPNPKFGKKYIAQILPEAIRLAEAGNPYAQTLVGLTYSRGAGVLRSFEESLKWYGMAEAQGEPFAAHNLGEIYLMGYGVEKDVKKSFEFYMKAAKAKYVGAQEIVGDYYARGAGIKQSAGRALVWWKRAADQGHSPAQSSLADWHYAQKAPSASLAVAYRWYVLAYEDKFLRPEILKTIQTRLALLRKGAARETRDDDEWLIFKDGSSAKDIPVRPKRPTSGHGKPSPKAPR